MDPDNTVSVVAGFGLPRSQQLFRRWRAALGGALSLLLAAGAPALGQEPLPATGFIWPVLPPGVSDPRSNTIDPRALPGDACLPSLWYSYGNSFANPYCPPTLNCVPPCYHPGEDWNLCSGDDAGQQVYAVANGKVVGRGILAEGRDGYYLTIEHQLTALEKASDYALTPTEATFSVVNSSYLHITDLRVDVNDVVTKGQAIAKIADIGPNHLHFELKTQGKSATNCPCGYCKSRQHLTDVWYINPTLFVQAHLNDLAARPLGHAREGRLEIVGPSGTFGSQRGAISAKVCDDEMSCRTFTPLVLDWKESRIEVDLGEELRTPVVLDILLDQGKPVGSIVYPFMDVEPGSWYGAVTTRAWSDGDIRGRANGQFFFPDDKITRAEFTEMLVKISGANCSGGCPAEMPYSDVVSDDWFYNAVLVGYHYGWIKSASTFRPHESITRAEAVSILVKADACAEILYPVRDPFVDVSDASEWFFEAVYQARELGLMTGYRTGVRCEGTPAPPDQRFFCPAREISRAEALQAIANAFMDVAPAGGS